MARPIRKLHDAGTSYPALARGLDAAGARLLSLAALVLVASFAFSAAGAPARAGEVVITTPTVIGCDDTSLDGLDVIVDGAILFLDCEHSFASLTLRSGALVTPSPERSAQANEL